MFDSRIGLAVTQQDGTRADSCMVIQVCAELESTSRPISLRGPLWQKAFVQLELHEFVYEFVYESIYEIIFELIYNLIQEFMSSKFENCCSRIKLRSSNFELQTSKFELRSSSFELRSWKFHVRSSKFEIRSSNF